MKRCVFYFLGLLAAIFMALVLENDGAPQGGDMAFVSDPGQRMALKSEVMREGWQSASLSTQKSTDASP